MTDVLKLVCTKCDTEFSQEKLDLCCYYCYDVQTNTLEVDMPCVCGNKFLRIKHEQKGELLLWPKK